VSFDYYNGAMALKAGLVSFMQDIIRIPSLSSQEGAVIQRIRDEMQRLGYDDVTIDPMGNLLGRIGNGPSVIALDGHVDTVDTGDPSLWQRDPHSGDIEDGILYGRGASDMKGGVASSVYAGALMKKSCRKRTATVCAGSTSLTRMACGPTWWSLPSRPA
jgi:acetylornithine deacetylase/succinyl-diaminopimelate desuccinylase-like protein